MASLMPLIQDFLAIFKIQQAWNKTIAFPWDTIFHPTLQNSFITTIDQASILFFLLLGVVALFRLPSLSNGAYVLLSLIPVTFTGTLQSASRYCAVLFPVFILLGIWGKNEYVNKVLIVLFFTIQIVFMALWTRFYFVV